MTNQQYKFVCEMIWGAVPVDKVWATESSLFKSKAPYILQQYPMLDKSNFNIKKCKSFKTGNEKDGVVVIYITPRSKKLVIEYDEKRKIKKKSLVTKNLFDYKHITRFKTLIYGHIFTYYNEQLDFTHALSKGWKFI